MAPNDDVNRLFWLAYCDTIKKEVGQLGPSEAIFFSTENQVGPPVECDPAYTNYGIFNLANNLLHVDNLFYAPSTTHSYIEALQNYLQWVDLGGNNSDANMLAVRDAKQRMDAAMIGRTNELRKAMETFKTYNEMGMIPPGQAFATWVALNAPAYQAAEQNVQRYTAQYKSANANMAGPLSGLWNQQVDRLTQAASITAPPMAGLNMQVTSSAPPAVTDILNAENSGVPLPGPIGLYNCPAYGCPDYVKTTKSWQATATQPPTRAKSATLDLQSAASVADASFGQETVGGGALSVGFGDIFHFGHTGAAGKTEQSLQASFSAQDVSVTMFWDDMAKVAISPGAWNVSDPKANYPRLKPKAPDSVKVLVKPSQLLLANKFGYTIKISSAVKNEFDQKVTSAAAAGGYVKVFGIPIAVGGAAASSEHVETTHAGSWDKASGTFTVNPSPQAGAAVILAVIGEKIQTF